MTLPATKAASGLSRYVPALRWIPAYRRADLAGDTIGALTAWAIVVPESVAYAEIAGVPPQNAFYAAPLALLAYALLGSSRSLIAGATSAAAILSASTVATVSSDPRTVIQLSAALAMLAGGLLIAAGFLRLGFITNFLAESALQGFLFGMAMTIVVRQAAKIVGISSGDGDFFKRLWHLISNVDAWSATTIAVGVAGLAALFLLERFMPKLPASLVVLVGGIVASYAFNLDAHGVAVVGKIPRSVPYPSVPDVSWHQVGQMTAGALGVSLIVFAESFSIARRFAEDRHQEVDGDQEMIGMGAANFFAGLFGGFAASGSASRTAAASAAGGVTQMLSIMAAVLVLITGAFLTPLFTQLPEPILGAIVIVAVRGFLRLEPLRRLWRRDRSSFSVAAAALLGVLVFDLLPGLLIAVLLSLVLFIARASEPELAVLGRAEEGGVFEDSRLNPDAVLERDALVVRPNGALFFGNVDRVRKGVLALTAEHQDPPVSDVLLVLTASYRLSLPVLDVLGKLVAELEHLGARVWLVGVPSSARGELQADDLYTRLGPSRIVHTIDDALAARPDLSAPPTVPSPS